MSAWRGRLLTSVVALVLAACGGAATSPAPTGQPVPTDPPVQAGTPTGQPTAPSTAVPTTGPTPTAIAPTSGPTEAPTDAPSAAPSGWRERADIAAGPSAREDHTWTVDGNGATAYLFGGRADEGASNELWAFDLATDEWTLRTPAGSAPPARWGHTATWVDGVGLVVWSGQAARGFFADVWTYDPAADAWRELPSLGDVPLARYGSCASLGPDGRLWISHGFTGDSGRFADTRVYEFATGEWSDETPAGSVPVERCLHDCLFSPAGRLVLYAGQTTGVPAIGDVWSFDAAGGGWQRGPDAAAPARQLYALAAAADAAIVFGGGSEDGGFLDDTWRLDLETLELSPVELPASPGPAARAGATLISDEARGRLLLFGGKNADGNLADAWELRLEP